MKPLFIVLVLALALNAHAKVAQYAVQGPADIGKNHNRICLWNDQTRQTACTHYYSDKDKEKKYANILADVDYFSKTSDGLKLELPTANFDLNKFANDPKTKHAFCAAGRQDEQFLQSQITSINENFETLVNDAPDIYGAQHSGTGRPHSTKGTN